MVTVLERYPCSSHTGGRNSVFYLCKCDCGKEFVVSGDELSKHPYSCGCTPQAVEGEASEILPRTHKNGPTIVHYGKRCHAALVDAFNMKEELHKSSETKGLADKDNPTEPINAIHRALKRFMRSHPSYDRGGLQGWLNLFWFIVSYEELSLFDKAKKLLQTAILTQKVVRHRDVLSKKFDK